MINMEAKYDRFFLEVKDIFFKFGWAYKDSRSTFDLRTSNILLNEREYCSTVKCYLKFFGYGVKFKNDTVGDALFDYHTIAVAEKKANEKNIYSQIQSVVVAGGWEDVSVDFSKSQLAFLKYDYIGSSFIFVDNLVEDPIFYLFWEGDEVTTDNYNLSLYLRNVLFWRFLFDFIKDSKIDVFSDVGWLPFYAWLYKNYKGLESPNGLLIRVRQKFTNHVMSSRIDDTWTLSVHRFECEFIRFLVKEEGLEPDIDVEKLFEMYRR